jgi:hypothetical protein
MEENNDRQERGQSIILIAFAIIILMVFAVIAVDLAYGYVHRRGDQNAADAAALGGAKELARIRNENDGNLTGLWIPEDSIQASMNDLAERNGIEDTDGTPANTVNTNVTGYYLDETGTRIQDANGQPIVVGQVGIVPPNAMGIEASTASVAPSFFGGIVGLDGLPIQAEAAVVFAGNVCQETCIAPIATLTTTFQYAPACYNIWDGSRQTGSGGGGGTTPTDPCAGVCQEDGTCSNATDRTCNNDNQCNFGPCENGFCRQNGGISCSASSGGNVCSNNTNVSCNNSNQCNFGLCQNNQCSGDSSILCSTDDECAGVCAEPYTPVCAIGGNPCSNDADCTATGDYCEDDQGGGNSGLGWLNWSLQGSGHSCQDVGEPSDCSEGCLEYNLTPDTCLSGMISVGDWVAGASGVKNASGIRNVLDDYIASGDPMTVVIYDVWNGSGCNQGQPGGNKLAYHVVGFAKFRIRGYMMSQGSGSAYCPGYDCDNCEDWGSSGNRITGEFLGWVDGVPGDCGTSGTIIAPQVIK